MQLGCLSTVAIRAPKNLTIIIMDNGIYQITGGQTTATSQGVDIVAVARGLGLAQSHWAADEADFELLFDAAMKSDKPSLIAAHIDNKPGVTQTVRDPDLIRESFMRGIGTKAVW